MLLRIRHLGAKEDGKRLYSVETASGLSGVIALRGYETTDTDNDGITLHIRGTYYERHYPSTAPLPPLEDGPPRIRDLEGGYQTVATFLATWEHATPEQREELCNAQPDLAYHPKRKKEKWDLYRAEDRAREVTATQTGDGWARAYTKDLRSALKGASGPVRIGPVTVRASWFSTLINTKGALGHGPVLELRGDPENGKLDLRSGDGKAQCSILHGAGDRYKGNNGFVARIAFVRA